MRLGLCRLNGGASFRFRTLKCKASGCLRHWSEHLGLTDAFLALDHSTGYVSRKLERADFNEEYRFMLNAVLSFNE